MTTDLERLKSAEKKNLELQVELELTKRAIAKLRAERNIALDRFYKEESALIDVGAFSDEDLGLHVGAGDDFDWAEMESTMVKKKLLTKITARHHTPTSSSTAVEHLPAKRRASTSGGPKSSPAKQRAASIESLAADDEPASQASVGGKSKRIIKTAEASAAIPRRVQSVPMDEDGRPILPITCGIVTVLDLGTIVSDRQPFHNKRYIWPAGFHSSRQYLSAINPDTNVTWHCEVKDGGAAPIFEVWPEDAPEQKFQSSTSTGVWTAVFKAAAAIRGKEASNSASGPDFYGFSNNTIAMMIETLPGVESCLNYQKKNFEIVPANPVTAAPANPTSGQGRMRQPSSSQVSNNMDVDVETEGLESPPSQQPQQHQEQHGVSDAADLFDLAARAMQQMK